MINLQQYSQMVGKGLNELIDNSDIRFVVWTDIGQFKHAKRKNNKVTTFINCLLTRDPGTIDTGNGGLIIASDNITLSVAVPTKEPRTTNEAPESEIVDDEFVFVERIRNVMDTYFSRNIIQSFTDEDGKTYETGMEYSLSATDSTDIAPMIGSYVTFSVNITVNIVQNGINSRSTSIEIDGETVPFMSASPSRASDMSIDVYSDNTNLESENLTTSTAFALDIAMPATTGVVTSQFIDYLLHGDPNKVHFTKITVGDKSRLLLMTFDKTGISVEGSLNIGQNLTLIKARPNADINSYPPYFTVGKIVYASDTIEAAAIRCDVDSIVYVGGRIIEVPANNTVPISDDADMLQYDETDDKYYVPIFACPKRLSETANLTLLNGNQYKQLIITQQGVHKNA